MKLALGSAQFGMAYGVANTDGQVSQESAQKILAYAKSVGIDTIDTAIAYGDSEACLGRAGVEDFNIITKLPHIPELCGDIEDWIFDEVAASLSRLGVENIYGLMLHRPEQLLGQYGEKILKSLNNLKKRGMVKKIGISVYSANEFEQLFALYDFDVVQCPFNLVDRDLVTSGWLSKLKLAGVEVHSRSSFLQGLLLMPRHLIASKFQPWDSLWDEWHDWLNGNAASPMETCVSYALSFPEIDRVVVGVDTKDQLEQIVNSTRTSTINSFPDITSNNPNLINPANWEV